MVGNFAARTETYHGNQTRGEAAEQTRQRRALPHVYIVLL